MTRRSCQTFREDGWQAPKFQLSQRFFLDLGVVPTWGEHELAAAILTWLEVCARELALAYPAEAPHARYFFVTDQNPGLQKRLEESGYTARNGGWRMDTLVRSCSIMTQE